MTKPFRVTIPIPAVITTCRRCREEIVLRSEWCSDEDRRDAYWDTALSWRGRRRLLTKNGELWGWSLPFHPSNCLGKEAKP